MGTLANKHIAHGYDIRDTQRIWCLVCKAHHKHHVVQPRKLLTSGAIEVTP